MTVERENVMLTMRRGHIEGTENKIDARLCVGVCFLPMTKAIFHDGGKTCCTRRKIIQGVVVGGREQRDLEVTIGQFIRVMPNMHKQSPCMRTAVSKSLQQVTFVSPPWPPSTSTPASSNYSRNNFFTRPCYERYAKRQKKCSCASRTSCTLTPP